MYKLKRFFKRYWVTILTLVLTMTILLTLLFRKDTPQNTLQIMKHLRPFWVLLTFGTVAATWLLEGAVYWMLARRLHPGWAYGQAFLVAMSGIFYGSITPLSSGGPPMQLYCMNKMGIAPGESAAVISAKSVTYQITMFLFSLSMICTALPFFTQNVSKMMWLTAFGLLANVVLIAGLLLVSFKADLITRPLQAILRGLAKLHLVKNPEQTGSRITGQFDTFREGFRTIGRGWKLYLAICAITVIQLAVGSLDTYCVYRAFGFHDASPWLLMSAKIFAMMVASLVPLPGNSGGFEAAFNAFFRIFFSTMITPALLVWRVVTYYAGMAVGFLVVSALTRRYIGSPLPHLFHAASHSFSRKKRKKPRQPLS
ncbi:MULTISPECIES: lysylphosphatidylglycerol synthase transmembrane domain-containing protein [Caproicibacterium]|uniref:Phosphatidylglycerol lysyltransferase n=1 Tax=Caproicibacterium argilliputei TaxID=3030016 RepID=A0AA97H0U8_9FIRM|nr:lysylphosphatidylglycerol synthase transmembrane domain-containing protein [Caproicibacterium argilliputei]WOC31783.1 lysylphosphatidylglycerol synthase transmembrane domain-containing protein [Caproicibacterium argilliputei]